MELIARTPPDNNSRVLQSLNSMSQDYIFNFSHGFERSQQEQQQNHIAHQIRRDKLRVQGFEPPPPSLVGLEEEEEPGGLPAVYETAGMLSEMFNFPSGATTATELLENQISPTSNYHQRNQQRPSAGAGDWYGNRVVGNLGQLGDSKNYHQHQISGINAVNESAAAAQAMQLFLMNPPPPRSPSSHSPSHHHHHHHTSTSSSTLHMLLPSPSSTNSALHHQQSFHNTTGQGQVPFGQFTWVPPPGGTTQEDGGTTIMENQGLSLSLSSSLQHLEATKVEELRIGDDSGAGMLYFNQVSGAGGVMGQTHPVHVGFGSSPSSSSSLGVVKVLRNSRYVKAAQELLEEFCSVGRGQFKKNKIGSKHNNPSNPNTAAAGSSSSSKDLPPLSASERIEHQRRKVKLLSMIDEVDRRYNHYCEQMQMVVNSFDLVMGFGSAVPYTALAQKAMSRHFRCLKDAIAVQLKSSCELLGEKDAGTSGVTKGETPRLKLLEQSLRQQRAFHQMGMMEQEAWRPQRGLPERSVNILRAWLFEHFLHPYPSDADKHLLARQTGLSRNQVSNWFINARVRLWKPMVEEMYQQESKDEEGDDDPQERDNNTQNLGSSSSAAQTPMPPPPTPPAATTAPPPAKRSEFNATENDPSLLAINTHHSFSENQATTTTIATSSATSITPTPPVMAQSFPTTHDPEACRRGSLVGADYRTTTASANNADNIGSTLIRFGTTTAGDVSLTLGLRHAGNLPEKSSFSLRDFGGC